MSSLKKAYLSRRPTVLSDDSGEDVKYAYSVLSANLYAQMSAKKLKCISVLGINDFDGSSEVALSLSVQMASEQKKVLYVDCNTKCPFLSSIATYPQRSDVKDYSSAITRCARFDFDVIFAEDMRIAAKTSCALNAKQMAEFVSVVKDEYEAVFFDFAGIKSSISSVANAKESDGALFVVNKLITKKKDFENMLMSIEHAGLNVVGCTFVNVK